LPVCAVKLRMSHRYNLSVYQALGLISLLDEKLKRVDFKSSTKFGVDFGGYTGSFGITYSGCTKVDCMTSIVKYLVGESMGPQPEHVAEWLNEKVPGWQDAIGYKDA